MLNAKPGVTNREMGLPETTEDLLCQQNEERREIYARKRVTDTASLNKHKHKHMN